MFNFIFQIQPAHPDNHDNWFIALTELRNDETHEWSLTHSKYHIPVIRNGKLAKEVYPIPDGPTVNKVPGVDYELFTVIEVARKATTKVEMIVAEFMKYL